MVGVRWLKPMAAAFYFCNFLKETFVKITRCFLLAILCLTLSSLALADEGMWLLNAPPRARIKAKYHFDVTPAFLEKLQLGSVRFNNGGSGSFVSPDGLAFTNHHVGRVCLQQLSTAAKDFIKDGFYAKTQAEEGKCPDLELNVLQKIEDVTAQVQGAAKPGMSDAEAGQAQRAMQTEIEGDCNKKTGLRCDVVTLYAGGAYHLYQYKKYTDVRVVFAPEAQMAFFGGDPDNFEYPRYDLDICYFRVYENDKPVHLEHYLEWAKRGVKDGDLIFVSGHPGRTERLLTMAELNFLKDVQTPLLLDVLTQRAHMLHDFANMSAENARVSSDDLFGIENSLKAFKGRNLGLHDAELMGGKAEAEAKLRKAIDADPKLKAAYAGAWEATAKAVETERRIYMPYYFLDRASGNLVGDLMGDAKALVRVTAEKQKPSAKRLREYGDARLASFEQGLLSEAPVYKSLEEASLKNWLSMAQAKLGNDNAVLQKILQDRTPEAVAKDAIANTKLDQVAVRKQLYEGGPDAIAASNDPLIVIARTIDPDTRGLRKQFEDEVDSVIRQNSTQIAKARFAVLGTDTYPDATFTLRLSYGVVKGYSVDGKTIAPLTNMGGAFTHAAENGNKDPFELPKSWFDAKSKLDLKTPFNFVSTADIIGGNSGSPTVNRKGEVVGIIFDGNIQSLPWDFAYEDKVGRAVSVDSRAILESMRKIYHADALANELEGKAKSK